MVDDYECRRQIERAAAAAAANANLKTRRRKHYFDYKRRAELNSRRAAHIDIEHNALCAANRLPGDSRFYARQLFELK